MVRGVVVRSAVEVLGVLQEEVARPCLRVSLHHRLPGAGTSRVLDPLEIGRDHQDRCTAVFGACDGKEGKQSGDES